MREYIYHIKEATFNNKKKYHLYITANKRFSLREALEYYLSYDIVLEFVFDHKKHLVKLLEWLKKKWKGKWKQGNW